MGWVKDAKANSMGAEAVKAAADGAAVFSPRLNMPATKANGMSTNIGDWAQMIEAIEEAGWQMVNWTVGMDPKGRAEAYPLFRRR